MNKSLENAILYEIYPTSFYDSNNDGVGDFQGIIQKLDYVKSLGVNVLWLNPFFLSPFQDGGYDITDYREIDPRFGTMKDFEEFVKKAKSLGFKILIDLVIGHTSVQCKWFKESAKQERNKYSDYYIWTDSLFATYKDRCILGLYERDGGYLVNYYACQPALNFGWLDMEYQCEGLLHENWKMHYLDERLKPLRDEMIDIMKFWMAKGIDGFRVDMASSIVKKHDGTPYEEEEERVKGIKWVWEVMMGEVKKDYPETIFLSEWNYPSIAVGKCGFDFDYLGHTCEPYDSLFRYEEGTNLMPGFEKGYNYFSKEGKGSIKSLIDYSNKLYKDIEGKGYFSFPSGCHDAIRLMSAVKDEEVVKTAFAFLLTYKHIPFFYYGDELGMKHNFNLRKDGGGIRTGCRTPMQWDNSKNRGFSKADECYLPANTDDGVSVIDEEKDSNSLLNTFKELVKIRNEHNCLNATSDIEFISYDYPFIYKRSDSKEALLIIINPSDKEFDYNIGEFNKPISIHNASLNGNNIHIGKQCYVILEK